MSDAPSYFGRLEKAKKGVVKSLKKEGIEKKYLSFGGEGTEKKVNVPNDANSEFLGNRAMGDWAEEKLCAATNLAFPGEFKAVPYGDSGKLEAGDAGFAEYYLAEIEATRKFGKRPDLLLYPVSVTAALDFSQREKEGTHALVSNAAAAVEVRSSKFEALKYMKVRKLQREAGDKAGRESPSFTVKVEDLIIVYRWIERYGVSQSYFQVFFDSVYAINVLDIFRIIAKGKGKGDGKNFLMEKRANSQQKTTIMIPITAGTRVDVKTEVPGFKAGHRVTKLGRHDVYVIPTGGGFTLDAGKVRAVLWP